MNREIIITNDPDVKSSQICVKLYPSRKVEARKTKLQNQLTNEIDIVELCLKDIDGNEKFFQMTPDEALEITGLLSHSISVYLTMFNKEYKKGFLLKRKTLNKIQDKLINETSRTN